ncbi:MAG: M4 family metallopeptidase [Rhodanobacter sp.]
MKKTSRRCLAVLLTLLALLPLQRAEAAKLHDLRRIDKHHFAEPYKQALLQLGARATKASIHARMLELDRGVGLVKNSEQVWEGVRTYRYGQTYQGIPIYKQPISVIEDQAGNIVAVAGYSIDGLDQDIPVTSAHISPEAALRLAESDWSMALQPLATFDHEAVTKIVFIDRHDVGHLAYVVTFQAFEMNNPEPTVPSVFVDAFSGKILEKSNTLMHAQATGPGGNEKIGRYEYGHPRGRRPGRGYLDVQQVGTVCTMINAAVDTIDLQHKTSGSTPYSFRCPRNQDTPFNGGFSSLNDTHYSATLVNSMYLNYLGETPWNSKLKARVHYSSNYDNAYFDPATTAIVIGDGGTSFYPFTSLDIIGHEIGHGFIRDRSSLGSDRIAMAINESFGDISGEATEFYANGTNDFLIGAEITKNQPALRSLSDPTSIGSGIDNVADFKSTTDEHDAAGIFDKAFYILANKPGWDTKQAFLVFAKAAEDYWRPNDDFQRAACGVVSAAKVYGYKDADVNDAFNQVGASCEMLTWDAATAVGLYGADKPSFADADKTIISPREPSSGDFGFASNSNQGRATGKRYVEFTVNVQGPATIYPYSGGICTSLRDVNVTNMSDAGMAGDFALCWLTDADSGATADNEPWFRDGAVIWANSGPLTNWRIKSGDTIGWAVDFDTGRIWFSLNGVWTGDPASGTGAQFDQAGYSAKQQLTGKKLKPHIWSDYQTLSLTLRGGASDMKYQPPTGFKRWSDAE